MDEEDFEFVEEPQAEKENVLVMSDAEWSNYVLSLLTDDEKFDGAPTTDGLRRVAIELLGIFSYDIQIHAVTESFAAITMRLEWPERTVVGSAECSTGNSDGAWAVYPLATAETRAEGRALKRALGLKRVLTAEETSKKAKLSVSVNDDLRTLGSITDTQITFIDKMCKKYDMDAKHIVEQVVGDFTDISKLTYTEAQEVNKLLDEWSKNKPENLGSYNSNWRNG
jgi:hypothetical protein